MLCLFDLAVFWIVVPLSWLLKVQFGIRIATTKVLRQIQFFLVIGEYFQTDYVCSLPIFLWLKTLKSSKEAFSGVYIHFDNFLPDTYKIGFGLHIVK